jgi:serine/threonine protein kinase
VSALKICPQCGTEYELDQRFCPKDGSTLKLQNAAGDLVGSIIHKSYHVLRKLGEGGMGTVYLAEHVKMGRKSAVKVMNPAMVHDPDAISRFNREAANASKINHPNVAAIYDFGETEDGLVFLAMEFIEGPSLTKVIQDAGSLPPLRAADITRQAAEALNVAHDMGIVHRDLKPDNIMLAKNRDGTDCVKVVDFGIAKAADNEAQKVTKTGLVVGTPEYMSPEQLAGEKLDGRSDTYSLALVAFTMLTGKLPFPAETAQESMVKRLIEAPKTLGEMKPSTTWSGEVQAVMNRALERDPGSRFLTATEFGRELHKAVQAMTAHDATKAFTAVMPPAITPAAPPRGAPVPRSPTAPRRSTPTPVQDVPATKINPATPAAAAPAIPRRPAAQERSKMPMIAGIAGVVLALAGGGWYVLNGKQSNGRAPEQQGDTAPLRQPVTAAPVANLTRAFEQIEPLTDFNKAANAQTATRALTLLDSIAPLAQADSDRVRVQLLRAEANMVLERQDAACAILKDNEGRASKTRFNARVRTLLNAC